MDLRPVPRIGIVRGYNDGAICNRLMRFYAGARRQRFFPVLGNRAWRSDGARPALDFQFVSTVGDLIDHHALNALA